MRISLAIDGSSLIDAAVNEKGDCPGLSTTLGIIKGHGRFINVYSEPGRVTQFKA